MTTYTLFGQANPGSVTSGSGSNGTNGLHFTVSAACTLAGIWHYSPGTSTQLPVTIGLYTTQASPATGTLVTSQAASWSGAAGSGWVFAAFSSPPSLVPGTNYMGVNFRNDASNEWFVIYTDAWPVTSGILTAPDDVSTGQGWYNIGTALTFPATQSGTAGDNFGMDVQVTTVSSVSSPPLIPPSPFSPMNFRRRARPSQAPVLVTVPEAGSGTDTASVTASIAGADTGSGAEGATAQPGASDTDTGHGAEAGAVPSASVTGTDTGSGADTGGAVVNLAGADTGSGAEASGVTVRPLLLVRWKAPDRLNRSGGTMGGT